jgi:hypothetical protein
MKTLFGFNWKKSNAHLELLKKFEEQYSPEDIYRSEVWCNQWKDVLGEHPQKAIKRFTDEGILVEADLPRLLRYKFLVKELKEMCQQRGLPVSGKKDDLISRLIQADEKGMQQLVKGLKLLCCTEKGLPIVQEYISYRKEERRIADDIVLDALKKKEFRSAAQTMIDYEANQVFSRGIGIDWKHQKTSRYVDELGEIFICKPKILDSVPNEKMELLRIMAGFAYLWGKSESRLFKDIEQIHSRLDNVVAARMIEFYIISKRNIAEYRETKGIIKFVKVLVAEDACEHCKKQSNKKYKLAGDIPELPDHKCTHEMGCRCSYIAEFDV